MMTNTINAVVYSTPTMSSREIADLTGKRHDHVVRDIEKMLNDIGEGLPKFGGTYINEQNGQEYRCYNLPKNLTLNLVTGYRADMRLKIIDRWLELEGAPENRVTPKPKRTRKPAFDTAFTRCMNVVALLPNVDENQKVLMAARGTHTLTGINPLEAMGYAALPAATEDNYQTPTQLGKPFGLSPRRVNQILVDAGLQVHTPGSSTGSDWSMTDKGLAYGKMFDTSRRGGKGSQQQLKWKPSVAEFLRPFPPTPARTA